MEKVQKNLVVIDYQYDFVALDGKLTCGQKAIDIEQNILNLLDEYKNDNVFFTLDTHYETDWDKDKKTKEAEIYPKHCIYNTIGHELYGKVSEKVKELKKSKMIYKPSFATESLVKNIILQNDPNEEISIQFCGVATNVCVFQNVILLYNYFVQHNLEFSITIDKKTVASFDEDLEKQALDYLVNTLNVKVV